MSELRVGEFEPVARGIYLEGLAVDYRRDIVWYSDVIGGGVHALLADGSIQSFNSDRMWTGGILLNEDGSVLSSGPGGIVWNHPESGKSGWLIHEIEGREINGINEMAPDGEGGLLFGTIDIDSVVAGGTPSPGAIYRLTPDRELVKLADDIGFSNGLMYDKERKQLYCNDTFSCCRVFDVSDEFTLTNRRVLLHKEDADGMALDAEGSVLVTGFRSSDVVRIGSDGRLREPLKTPADAITQIRFGGPDMRDFYINTVPGDGGDNLKEGEIPTENKSIMYRGRADVPGRAVETARFSLS